jgi:hypothetical protein
VVLGKHGGDRKSEKAGNQVDNDINLIHHGGTGAAAQMAGIY